ncbi:MAG: tRNA pseudouridine(13) synthase TruD [Trueperaceae bacterium]|nr:tRNA pseudouridine(13) synthase TruD [Trueperaceae bacterium]
MSDPAAAPSGPPPDDATPSDGVPPIFAWDALPSLRGARPGTGGRIRSVPEDFVVVERPAYLPAGRGSHLYLRVRKRGLATRDLVRTLVEAGVPENRIGVAGLKDKHAVTEQWLSLPWAQRAAADVLAEREGVEVLETSRHANKLGIGHLHGNRFTVVVRDVAPDAEARARAILDDVVARGLPNYVGPQRFGRFGRNAVDGRALLRGETVPGDRRLHRFFVNALQSWIFNDVLAARIRDGHFASLVSGDWARKVATGGTFRVDDPDVERPRAAAFEITALLALHGRKVRISSDEAGRYERAALARAGVRWEDLRGRRGDRRPSRVAVGDVALEGFEDDAGRPALRLAFDLPKGAYATSLLREVTGLPVDAPAVSPHAGEDA